MSKLSSSEAMTSLPMGFGMALLQNEKARATFDALPLNTQMEIINGTHAIRSKKEMQQYVSAIPLR